MNNNWKHYLTGAALSCLSLGATAEADALNLKVYGFVQADMIYDFKRVDPDWNDTLRVSTIPTTDGAYGDDGEFIFGVRQSRLGISANYGEDVTMLFEYELFGVSGDAGQTTPRLRHAWVTWKEIGAGQTWSNFMDIDIFPNTIDYWGPTGMVFYRNKQARYTFDAGEDEFSIAIEDPDTSITVGRFRDDSSCDINNPVSDCGSTIDEIVDKYNDIPDLTVRYRDNTDWGHWQLAGIARKLGYERTDTNDTDEEFGWGINASTSIKMLENDRLKLQVVYGEGIGNYMNDGGVDIAPDSADITTTGVEAVEMIGVVAYYDHYWSKQWSTSIGYSFNEIDTTEGQADNEYEKGQIAQVNLLHYPQDNVLIGGEIAWGEREDISGESGDDIRIQFSLKVSFDSNNLKLGLK
ncbi:DcaP family trimeric outer membrane transporter [Oceanicoccus sagamiensis]|uniref:Porin domain-containing protein n=1 Tax=Oceanicoccus sagamiensis TaxID=716816 RepID=A0A1X9NI02_9GAMM|nr:DcaP family trimeric outer membrane transporter [Oceanicoccus sagamiensis]ARN75139.1 hypothetical protein BST96_14045 [Oceanicoccus sagamiensis]